MEPKKNLCAQVPVPLHTRVREEQEKSGLTLSQYVTQILTEYYEKGEKAAMENTDIKTLAFQIPAELFQRLKDHLARESRRTGKKVSQKDFLLDLITKALDEADAAVQE